MQLNFEQLFIKKYLSNFVKPTQKICIFAASKKVGWSPITLSILNTEYQIIKIINKQNNNTKMKREFTKLMAVLALLLFIAPLGMWGQTREITMSDGYTVETTPLSSVSNGDLVVWGISSSNLAYSCGNNWIYCNTTQSDWIVFTVETTNGGFYLKTPDNKYVYSSADKKVSFDSSNKTILTITDKDSDHTNIVYGGSSVGYYTLNGTGIRPYKTTCYTDAHLYLVTASTPTPTHAYTLNVTGDDADAEASLYVNGEELGANDEIAEGETVTVSVIPSDGYAYSVSVKDANNVAVEYDDEMDSFTMPSSAVTITVTTTLIPTYTVTFNTNGGTFVGNNDFPQQSNTKEAGTYTLPSATK